MDVIPVIDVRHGVAVAAVGGQRAAYRPLQTPLAEGCDPGAVARGLAALFEFPVIYVADLDGIEGRGRNIDLPAALGAAAPGACIWIDDGTLARDAAAWMGRETRARLVLGSESMTTADDVAALRALAPEHYVLSLDFKDDRFAGAPAIIKEAQHWARDVIVMTLALVGSGAGPDVAKVAGIAKRAGGSRRVYAAGGVRHRADIEALRAAGAAGVLVASALHAGTLKAGDLAEIAGL
jgi:uncharacterized protein related to proFAR isomerase